MSRNRAYTRYVRNKSIIRKKRISKAFGISAWYPYDGQYSKGKIHCSCGMCRYDYHSSKTYLLSKEIEKSELDMTA